MKLSVLKSKKATDYIDGLNILVITGAVIRIVFFFINLFWAEGVQIDEAMTALNAYNLVDNGTDLLGNSYPVYFSTWIVGGQSPVATYICALSVLIFGKNLFALRLPALVTGIVGVFGFSKLAKELFNDEKMSFITTGLAAFSPWFIFSSVYVLDCNFLTYILIFALYYLLKSIKSGKWYYFAVSMFLFSLGLNSYIASVLIIPIFLVTFYAIIIAKNKIKFNKVVLSVGLLLLFSLPFILFGLVSVGIIPEFKIGNITFGGMQHYQRSSSLAFTVDGGVAGFFSTIINNLSGSLSILMLTDFYASIGYSLNIFQYGNCLSGIFLLIGIIVFFISIIRKRKQFNVVQISLLAALLACVFMFCAMTNEAYIAYGYRYGVLSLFLVLFQGIGMGYVFSIFKKINYKKMMAVYLTLSICVFSVVFFARYAPQTDNQIDMIYGDSLFDCLDYLEEKDADINLVSLNYTEQSRSSVYIRYYYYGINDFVNFYDEYYYGVIDKKEMLWAGDNIRYYYWDDNFEFTQPYYIVSKYAMDTLENYEGYNAVDFGAYMILEK